MSEPTPINAPLPKSYAEVLGRRMAYHESGVGRPIVLVHGNPTSSYLWRNVIPHLEGLGRLIAPDHIGMGDSDKLPDSGPDTYTFDQLSRYFEALLEHLGVNEDVVLVVHDWGSALGFDWANRHRSAVSAIAYMEAIVAPLRWSDYAEDFRPVFEALRSPAGDQMVLQDNMFVEQILPGATLAGLAPEVLAEYRRPFREPGESRRPTLTLPRQLPIDGEPADVNERVASYSEWLAQSDLAKLMIKADPGVLLRGRLEELARAWPNQKVVTVPGIHFVQEDSGPQVGQAIAAWLRQLG